MNSKRLFILVMGICLVLALAVLPFIISCAQPAPAPPPAPAPAPKPAPAPAPVATEKFVLRYSSQWPEMSPKFKDSEKKLLDEIEQKSNGRITFNIFAGGTLGGGKEQYDIVSTGKADLCTTTTGYHPGRFPLCDVLTLPGAFECSYNSEKMTLQVLDRILKAEFQDTHILTLHQTEPFWLYFKKPVKTLEDVKGLKMRTGGGMVTPALEALGAIPVSMPIGDLYLAVQTGVVDGTPAGAGATAFKIYEVVSHEVVFIIGCYTDVFVMNLGTWNKLPKDLQAVMDEVYRKSGNYEVDAHFKELPNWNQKFLERGGKSYTLPGDEAARWINALKPVVNKWVTDLEAKGKPAKQALDIVREECKKLNVPFPY